MPKRGIPLSETIDCSKRHQGPQLLVITRQDIFKGEAAKLNDLFEAGLTGLHLRKPGATHYELQVLLRGIYPGFHKYIIIHNHIALLQEFDLLGVHLPLGRLLQTGKISGNGQISCSTHTDAEVQAAAAVADYAFISPVFDSISKSGYKGNPSLLTVQKPKGDTRWVALGGITPHHFATVRQHGFDAVALMGYIWSNGQPRRQFEACQAKVARLVEKRIRGGKRP